MLYYLRSTEGLSIIPSQVKAGAGANRTIQARSSKRTNRCGANNLGRNAMIEETIERAKALRRDDELEASQEVLLELLSEHPDHPLVLFEVGGSYDVMGEESRAIPFYRRALDAGLSGDDRQECLVCLGSSLRVVGEFEEAVETLEEAVEEFPSRHSGRVFLALAYYSNDQPEEAVRTLLDVLLQTTTDEEILAYADALDYYKDNLDEIGDD
jgi:tetratricopeptide (TPR) repeat protein